MNLRKQNLIGLIILSVCVLFAGTAMAQDKPSGTLEISSETIAIGIGVSWGHGTLKFQGKEYKFKVNGLSVVDLGISSVSAAGEVYNLKSISDFSGNYSGGGAGVALAGGAGVQELTNQNGVPVANGVYLCLWTVEFGNRKVSSAHKIAILR